MTQIAHCFWSKCSTSTTWCRWEFVTFMSSRYQHLVGGNWVEMELTADVKPWCKPANPRLLCRKDDVHLTDGRQWSGAWVLGHLVSDGAHPPLYRPAPTNNDSGVFAGWEYAASLRDMTSVPLGLNPDHPQLSSRIRYRLWVRWTRNSST